MKQQSIVIGSGIAGIASAIRLAVKGYEVKVFEQAPKAGGKISEIYLENCRFDTGPSLFTMPWLVDELFLLSGKDPKDYFRYTSLDMSCKYFWEDQMVINSWNEPSRFASEIQEKTGVRAKRVMAFLNKSKRLYDLTSEVFLFSSLHAPRNYLKPAYRRALLHLFELDVHTSMHNKNAKWFSDPRVVQLFNRYATYNGSNPYKTPATLNIIPHLEHNTGAWFPVGGMYGIVSALQKLATDLGVQFHFNSPAEGLHTSRSKVHGVVAGGKTYKADLVVSDVDVVQFYKTLLPESKIPGKQEKLERSSSALIFYWAMNRETPQLGLHNILFSKDYPHEFDCLFNKFSISSDPTVYIFISKRAVESDAPPGMENWYVMVNAPQNIGQNWEKTVAETRDHIMAKINRTLNIDPAKFIQAESIADPRSIEKNTGSYRGSLYGLSSNSRFSAFNRHPNFSRKLKNLYFTGGSVHPGGGIPLCLASAAIADQHIPAAK